MFSDRAKAVEVHLGYLRDGAFFGESALVGHGAGTAGNRRLRTVRAIEDCELCYLTLDDFLELKKVGAFIFDFCSSTVPFVLLHVCKTPLPMEARPLECSAGALLAGFS